MKYVKQDENWANSKLVMFIEQAVESNTDLQALRRTAKSMTPKTWSINKYQQHIVDGVLDYYNVFNKHNSYLDSRVKEFPASFSSEEIKHEFNTAKNYCRKKAVWMGFKEIANHQGYDTSKWYYNPRQQKLL